MDRAEAIEHLLQIPRATVDVLNRIVAIADTKFPCGSRHELSEPRRASRTDCHGIEARFLPHQSQEEARGERVSRFCLPNEWLVQGFLEASIDMIRFAIWLAEIERSWVDTGTLVACNLNLAKFMVENLKFLRAGRSRDRNRKGTAPTGHQGHSHRTTFRLVSTRART